jgi:hypothetical protein
MTEFDDLRSAYQRYSKALVKANTHNKTVVFDALAAAGLTTVTVEFDGEGDSGQIESVVACTGEAHVDLPEASVTLLRATTQRDTDTPFPSECSLAEAIETLCYDYLEQEHGGWENNDGAFGTFQFDIGARAITLEFNGRYSDTYTNTHNF